MNQVAIDTKRADVMTTSYGLPTTLIKLYQLSISKTFTNGSLPYHATIEYPESQYTWKCMSHTCQIQQYGPWYVSSPTHKIRTYPTQKSWPTILRTRQVLRSRPLTTPGPANWLWRSPSHIIYYHPGRQQGTTHHYNYPSSYKARFNSIKRNTSTMLNRMYRLEPCEV